MIKDIHTQTRRKTRTHIQRHTHRRNETKRIDIHTHTDTHADAHKNTSMHISARGPSKRAALPVPCRVRFMLIVFRSFSLVLALLGRILSPSCRKMAPKWSNIDQHSAKMGQNCFPRAPKSSKNLKKPLKT